MKLQAQTSGTEARNLAFGSPCFPCEESLISAAQLLELAPGLSVHHAVSAIFPFGKASGLLRAEAAQLVTSILPPQPQSEVGAPPPVLEEVLEEGAEACVKIRICRDLRTFRCRRGPDKVQHVALDLPDHQRILTGMLLSALVGRDICLIGPRGEGKTFLARQFGHALGYSRLETLFLHEEMTARDLFQRRATNRQGESTWEPSPLLQAMQNGGLCVLDGLQQLRPGSLASLIQVIQDREVTLYDGTRFVSPWRWKVLMSLGLTSEQLSSRGLRCTHPTFRLVALATPNDAHRRSWLTNEVLQLFHFFTLPLQPELVPVIAAAVPDCPDRVVRSLLRVRQLLYEASQDSGSSLWTGTKDDGANPSVMLSLRAILRAARTAAAAPSTVDIASEIGAYLQSALMTDFMPAAESGAVLAVLRAAGFRVHSKQARLQDAAGMAVQAADLMDSEPTLRIGTAVCRVQTPLEQALVPETQFFHNPQQTLALHDMLRDIAASEHLLLMGNQGVGKNKLIDKMLMLLHREREYIQLHRDTTVGSLTLVPSLRNGLLCYDDSPLVKAMINGRVLVIDEFDKAPTEVVLTLKGLLQDGEILLADGRRFVRHRNIHEAFLVVALANRPGFPFLGNDFFREMGDCFACHAVQNPDQVSEVAMLQSYAPQVPVALLEMLSASFSELRQMVEDGKLSYPYSTRELVNIVRHLAVYPDDSIDSVMENVFAFDAFDAQLRQVVFSIFRRHGLPLASDSPGMAVARRRTRIAAAVHLGPPEKVATFQRSHSEQAQQAMLESPLLESWRRFEGGWLPFKSKSSRSREFSEEDRWWALGFVTTDGVVIKGKDPITGSWLGALLGMASAQGCLCILSSQMALHVYDVHREAYCEISLAAGSTLKDRASYAIGCSLLPVRDSKGGCVCTYDTRNAAHLSIWPADGVVYSLKVQPPSSPQEAKIVCAGLLADLPLAIYHAESGSELLLVRCGSFDSASPGVARLALDLPAKMGLLAVYVLSRERILLRCADSSETLQLYELVLPTGVAGNSENDVDAYLASLSSLGAHLHFARWEPKLEPRFWSPVHPSELALQPHLAGLAHELSDGDAGDVSMLSQVLLTEDTYCSFAVGLNVDVPGNAHPIMGYRRSSTLSELQDVVQASTSFQTSPRHFISCWHGASKSLVSVSWLSDSRGPVYSVDHGCVWLEVVDVANGQMRRIVLGKVPGMGLASRSLKGAGTDNSLAEQGMLLTRRGGSVATAPARKQMEMPSCVACCEMEDGRLALLFADSHVRILEIRKGQLAVQEALHRSMRGAGADVDIESLESESESRSLPGESEDDEADDLDVEDTEEGEETEESSVDHRSASTPGMVGGSRGKGRGRRGKRGKGRLGGGRGGGARQQSSKDSSGDAKAGAGAGKVLQKARERAMLAVGKEKLELELADLDIAKYDELFRTVEKEVTQLRVILQAVEAKEKERTWLRGKTVGELDDSKIVDFAIGEKTVFKHRGQREDPSVAQALPKRLSFVVDVSGSMAVFNGDGRLDRLCASMVMVMEGLFGLEHKYLYEIVGHSGETDWLPFVRMGKPPRNRAERFAVVNAMADHASFARSGDNTLSAGIRAMTEIVKEQADDYFVFLVSDANLRGYGISPQDLATALTSDRRINAHAIFIAEPDAAQEMKLSMPVGHAHLVLDTEGLPLLLKNIFAKAVLTGLSSKL
ncbi:unnamed protein product [Symbiodinium sp. CCMP2456]|nr:unnamed protein product [Symbiodinium sp. CCMP2456]